MDKSEVKKISKIAGKLMKIDSDIWDRHGWTNGGMVKEDIHQAELKKGLNKAKISSLDSIYEHIFEDANYH